MARLLRPLEDTNKRLWREMKKCEHLLRDISEGFVMKGLGKKVEKSFDV